MSGKGKPIRLFYWSSRIFEGKTRENYGDLIAPYIVSKLTDRPVEYYNAPKKKKSWFPKEHLLAIGSIISYGTAKSRIWGSGIISRQDRWQGGTLHAVRGPKTRERAMELGFECPAVYGDPALLMPEYYHPQVEVQFDWGIIPHYVDHPQVNDQFDTDPTVTVIDLLCNQVEPVTDRILECRRVISSSLHGVILCHAYGIPAIWVRFSDRLTGDNIKFEDYFRSVGIEPYQGPQLELPLQIETVTGLFDRFPYLPAPGALERIKQELKASFPYS